MPAECWNQSSKKPTCLFHFAFSGSGVPHHCGALGHISGNWRCPSPLWRHSEPQGGSFPCPQNAFYRLKNNISVFSWTQEMTSPTPKPLKAFWRPIEGWEGCIWPSQPTERLWGRQWVWMNLGVTWLGWGSCPSAVSPRVTCTLGLLLKMSLFSGYICVESS